MKGRLLPHIKMQIQLTEFLNIIYIREYITKYTTEKLSHLQVHTQLVINMQDLVFYYTLQTHFCD